METHSISFSELLRLVATAGLLSLAAGYPSSANAEDGCGCGYHRSFEGGCIRSYQGSSFVTPTVYYSNYYPASYYSVGYSPTCWNNDLGYCY
ncbi:MULTISPECIES: GCG_CRPN prefix-to-repeats domain-containing protein [Legionella]|uniref:Uncharacterized protein n=1 Tax=Legionella drozanskii LLAP-1 TaxID=1212489 RepID=A0A0W0SWE3_9GAMM|nr:MULTISPECIES: hypothetical protein [Legionella]KTC87620.1 hypothetical protein Ldro_1239 [Legionella drozanskii LLAP-1]PJE12448.1 MAG: hypothetical protein CK430_07560 [Legionella sp.]